MRLKIYLVSSVKYILLRRTPLFLIFLNRRRPLNMEGSALLNQMALALLWLCMEWTKFYKVKERLPLVGQDIC